MFTISMIIYSGWVYFKNFLWGVYFNVVSFIENNFGDDIKNTRIAVDKAIHRIEDANRHRSKLSRVLTKKKQKIHEMNSEIQRAQARIAKLERVIAKEE